MTASITSAGALARLASSLTGPQEGTSKAESRAKDHAADEIAMKRLQSGDKEALGLLYDRYCRTVLSVGLRILRDRSEAQELVQDVFIYVFRKCGSFDPTKGSVASWLLQIAYCRAFDKRNYLISRRFYDYCNIDEIVESVNSTFLVEGFADQVELKHTFERAFSQLTESQKRTLELFFFEGYSLREISIHMVESLANIRNHYYRGLGRLRSAVKVKGKA